MSKKAILALLVSALALHANSPQKPFALAIHGGAGLIKGLSPEKEKAYKTSMEAALQAGYTVLEKGGSSLDAVETAVKALEDDPLFNAGKGAVLTWDGHVELDAAIMDGRTLAAGSVAGLKTVKSPIGLARLVMEKSPHVMLIGQGAEDFARLNGLPPVENVSFITPARFETWKEAREKAGAKKTDPKGTVGAVALDQQGNLAAATSTGGMLLKRWGRVGDAPLIGVGTYANNQTCAVSCTGWGEYFIRTVVAHDIASQMAYGGLGLEKAAEATLAKVKALGGDGGLIALDAKGNITTPYNSLGMHRAWKKSDGQMAVKIYENR